LVFNSKKKDQSQSFFHDKENNFDKNQNTNIIRLIARKLKLISNIVPLKREIDQMVYKHYRLTD